VQDRQYHLTQGELQPHAMARETPNRDRCTVAISKSVVLLMWDIEESGANSVHAFAKKNIMDFSERFAV
jgi:hypothetical protein